MYFFFLATACGLCDRGAFSSQQKALHGLTSLPASMTSPRAERLLLISIASNLRSSFSTCVKAVFSNTLCRSAAKRQQIYNITNESGSITNIHNISQLLFQPQSSSSVRSHRDRRNALGTTCFQLLSNEPRGKSRVNIL